ncbi:MAG: xanthine dehydrogenase accessory factor [Candidatus Binatota bacterium]|nr:xanthine dehydrogenase accessory factor [Candidatus Binatota bacterium]
MVRRVRDIWLDIAEALDGAAPAALATILRTSGSAYQREGAKLLYRTPADVTGAISGGCLEMDVRERCGRVAATGISEVARYVTGGAESVFGVETGCQGTIEVLIEPIDAWRNDAARAIVIEVSRRIHRGDSAVVLTVLERDGERVRVADRGLDDAIDRFPEAKSLAAGGRAGVVPLSAGREAFVDVVRPALRLVVFGAGEDVRPLVAIAAEVGMAVTVVDRRPGLLTRERFPAADALVSPEEAPLEGRPAVVVMTHEYAEDRGILEKLLGHSSEPAYVGVLGPRDRTRRLIEELAAMAGVEHRRLEAIRTPAGLDVGARSPAEIALSIVGEILALDRQRTGVPLRDLVGRGMAETVRRAG